MQPDALFAPVIVLVLLTLAVLLYTGLKRFSAGFAGRVKGQDFRYGESANVPPDVAVANRNFMNLLEAPLLFYVFCLVAYVTHHVSAGVVYLAWAYVGLRVLHTGIHLAYNRILYRFGAFALSTAVLLVLWLWLGVALFG